MLSFCVSHRDGAARRGRMVTPHGVVDTPAFMPVGTAGTVKGVWPAQLRETGAQMILANTYHLQLRPGADVVEELGGLHAFMGWDGPILTDSGGYQIFSLGEINRITDEGVEFRSHIDGARLSLDPVSATAIQNRLGADIIMAFDQCPPLPADDQTIRVAVQRTLRWARTCHEVHARREEQALFGIVQGGLDADLRRICAEALLEIGFDGYAVGGLSVGETFEQMVDVLGPCAAVLPDDRPRYLMGVGMPRDILAAVRTGIDMFDCVLPTRNGRNSYAFTAVGPLRLRNERYKRDSLPLEEGCDCATCQRFSRGYIRHLFLADEMLGPILVSVHNIRFFQRFMSRVRERIEGGSLGDIIGEFPVAAATVQTDTGADHESD